MGMQAPSCFRLAGHTATVVRRHYTVVRSASRSSGGRQGCSSRRSWLDARARARSHAVAGRLVLRTSPRHLGIADVSSAFGLATSMPPRSTDSGHTLGPGEVTFPVQGPWELHPIAARLHSSRRSHGACNGLSALQTAPDPQGS